MAYKVQPKRMTVAGNELVITMPTRREANAFREAMGATDNPDEQQRIGFDYVANHITLADGSPLDLDDVPIPDSIEMLKILAGATGNAGVSDFTHTP